MLYVLRPAGGRKKRLEGGKTKLCGTKLSSCKGRKNTVDIHKNQVVITN